MGTSRWRLSKAKEGVTRKRYIMISRRRGWWLAFLLILLPAPVALLGVVGKVLAVSPTDPYRTCESKNGQFIDKNNDGEVGIYDWRRMSFQEKFLQATWNLETVCKQATPAAVAEMIKSLDAISELRF